MFKGAHHPKAFLSLKRNVRRGLVARTQIILILEKGGRKTKVIAQKTKLSYASVLHHLHLLKAENIVTYTGRKSYVWELTGAGQQRLINP